jgi:tetratricopeptide (TPR) repeat protein
MYDYIGGLDSYDLDKSNTGSLGALCIWKRYKAGDPHNDMLVATYVGRPDKAEEFYQIALDLVIYYNAITMFENQNKGVQVYFENKNKGHMLADTPDLFIKTIISRSTVNRGKGIHMTKAIKDAGEMLLRDWLLTQYTTRGEEIVYNTSKLYERATLQELVAYEDKGNYDRAIALFLIFIFMSNLAKVKAVVNDDEEATPNNWNLKAFITKQRA